LAPEKPYPKPWFIEPVVGHQFLAMGCLDVLHTQLYFNICVLESSYYLNSEIEDLDRCITHYISSELAYASKFWPKHLAGSTGKEIDNNLLAALNNCFPEHVLYWLEIMSFLRCIDVALSGIKAVKRLVHVGQGIRNDHPAKNWQGHLGIFLEDVEEFIGNFGSVIV
jgi:hypothetical protein